MIRALIFTTIVLLTSNICLAGYLADYQKHGRKSAKCTPLIEAGFSAYDVLNIEIAESFFEKAIGEGCKDGLVYFALGIRAEARDDFVSAKRFLKLAAKYLPAGYGSTEAARTIHEQMGRVLFSLGEHENAKTELNKAAQIEGNNFNIMFLLGSIARKERNDFKVLEYYGKALTFAPPPEINAQQIAITLLVEIGISYYNLKDYDNSIMIWKKILAISPHHPIARQFYDKLKQQRRGQKLKSDEKKILDDIVK